MNIQEKIKLMISGDFVSKYESLDPLRKTDCFSCHKIFTEVSGHSHGKYKFCDPCWVKFFIRKSGTKIDGRDRTRVVARIRDNHTCAECNRVWKLGERCFDIHHLDGLCGKLSCSYDKIDNIDNLITLCHKCHLNLDEVIEKMKNKSSPRPNK